MASASAYLRRVSERTVQALLAEPTRVRKVLFPSSTETVIDDEVLITIGSTYELIDLALEPWDFLRRGGTAIGDVVVGDGPARAFTPAEVRKYAAKLALTQPGDIGRFLGQATFLPPDNPAAHGDAVADFTTVKDFVTETARAEAAMIVYLG